MTVTINEPFEKVREVIARGDLLQKRSLIRSAKETFGGGPPPLYTAEKWQAFVDQFEKDRTAHNAKYTEKVPAP